MKTQNVVKALIVKERMFIDLSHFVIQKENIFGVWYTNHLHQQLNSIWLGSQLSCLRILSNCSY